MRDPDFVECTQGVTEAPGSGEPLREAMLAVLETPARAEFLIALGRALGISARGSYRATATRRDTAVDEFESHNEVLIVVLSQLSHVLGYGMVIRTTRS